MTKSKHIIERRQQAEDAKRDICTLLGWTEDDYCAHQYECGLAYLHKYIPTDEDGIDLLQRNKIFWNWWKNRWADRDRQFINEMVMSLCTATRVKLYYEVHSPRMLANTIYPNAVVLQDTYELMFKQITAENH